jgi:hypothetical protein
MVHDAHARTYRAAALVWQHANREPDADLDRRVRPWLDVSPGQVRLAWERLGARRFRVGVDPRAPQPVPMDQILGPPDRRLGAHPSPQAQADQIAHHVLEFNLP